MTLKTVPVTGTLFNPDGSVAAGAAVTAQLTLVDTDAGVVAPNTVSTTADSNGAFTLNLWPNARGVNGSQYRVRAQVPGALPGVLLMQLMINVPDSDPALPVPIANIATRTLPAALSDSKAAMLAAQGYSVQAAQSATSVAFLYPGTYAVAPTTRPGGSAIQAGDRYNNSADGYEYIYISGAWSSPAKNATASQAAAAASQAAAAIAVGSAQFSDYSGLRSYSGSSTTAYITGAGLSGLFTRDDADTTSADDARLIIVATNGKRWKRTNGASWFKQAAEFAAVDVLQVGFATAGVAPFQLQTNSAANAGGGAGTNNHGFWYGYNAARHSGGPGLVNGQMAWMMGIERDFFDAGGDNLHGAEWYIQAFSPDGATVQFRRPFYARGWCSDDGVYDWMQVYHQIGTDGRGSWSVRTTNGVGGLIPLLVTGTNVQVTGHLSVVPGGDFTLGGALVGNSGANKDVLLFPASSNGNLLYMDSAVANVNFQVDNAGNAYIRSSVIGRSGANKDMLLRAGLSAGSFVVQDAAGANANFQVDDSGNAYVRSTVTGRSGANSNLLLRAGNSAGSVTFTDSSVSNNNLVITNAGDINTRDGATINAFGSTGLKLLGDAAKKLGLYGATPVVRQTVTGSRGGNAALASLLTALATWGAITDSTTA